MTDDPEVIAVFIEEATEFLDGLRIERTSKGIAVRLMSFRESCRLIGFREPRYEVEDVISCATRAAHLNQDLCDAVRRYSEALIPDLTSLAHRNGLAFVSCAVVLFPEVVAISGKRWWHRW